MNFVFIICSYNNEAYVAKNLMSVFHQTYKNWRIIYTDDASEDKTVEKVKELVKCYGQESRLNLKVNDINRTQSFNRYHAYPLCQDKEVIVFLDGDDWLFDEHVLEKLNTIYTDEAVWLTYGSYRFFFKNKLTASFHEGVDFSEEVIASNSYRKIQEWIGIPLRTGYAFLYKNLPKEHYLDTDSNWMHCGTDVVEFLWAAEQSNGKIKCIKEPMYVYNIDSSIRFENSTFNASSKLIRARNAAKIYSNE